MRYYYGAATTGTLLGGYTYLFDELGNITKIWDAENSQQIADYEYDDKNQLIQETIYHYNGSSLTSTDVFHYIYDGAGNLQRVTNAAGTALETYTYGNSSWADLLTGYNGRTINYDGAGNPLNWYNGSTFTNLTWTNGRQLSSITKSGGGTYRYTYDMAGYRSSKVVDGVTHYYHTLGGKLVRESYGSTILDFIYYPDGTPLAMRYSADGGDSYSTYYYVLNTHGEIIQLVHPYGDIVAEYQYDAWGNILSASGSRAEINPLRYRGYYYDSETGFYYVGSRYYDPAVGRFINADSAIGQIGNVQGINMFAYCFNNPVNMSDPTGNWPKLSTVFAVVAVAAVAVAAVTVTVATCGAAAPALVVAGSGIIGGITAGATTAAGIATGATIVAGVSAAAAVTSAVAEKTVEKIANRNNSVYVLKDGTGAVQYVGRTNNVSRRRAAHSANPARAGLEMEVIASGLNLPEARALEQAGMAYYHTINTANRMNNQINSVSPKYWGAFKELALGVLNYGWNQMSNEILYWTGN